MTAYSAFLRTDRPGCVVVLIDQSGSMSLNVGGDPEQPAKAGACARAVNRVIKEICMLCTSGPDIKDRCHVGVIGYGSNQPAFDSSYPGATSALGGKLRGKGLVPVSQIAPYPLRIETLQQKVSDGAGGLVSIEAKFPIWVEPMAEGGTPMADAFHLARSWLQPWVAAHAKSFPPVIVNITDGAPADASRDFAESRAAAAAVAALSTEDGNTLVLNAHVSETRGAPLTLPGDRELLPDAFARFLFDISSVLPERLRANAEGVGLPTHAASRGFVFNADVEAMVKLLQFGTIGTVAAQPK